jgi:hypothetical protein
MIRVLWYRRYRHEDQTGVRSEGQSEIFEEGRAEIPEQATGKKSEEGRSGITLNPTGTLARGLKQEALYSLCAWPCDASHMNLSERIRTELVPRLFQD